MGVAPMAVVSKCSAVTEPVCRSVQPLTGVRLPGSPTGRLDARAKVQYWYSIAVILVMIDDSHSHKLSNDHNQSHGHDPSWVFVLAVDTSNI